MNDDRKKPGAALWCSVALIVALIAYPLSFGPACWATSRLRVGADTVSLIYQPITWAVFRSQVIAAMLIPYSELLAAPDWHWVLFVSEAGSRWMPFSLESGIPVDLDDMDAPTEAP
jgi:hypothetical protein